LPIIANQLILEIEDPMPTRNVNLTSQMDRFVADRIKSGQYANASEVVRAGIRALERDEQHDRARLAALRTAIRAGEQSGIAEDDVFAELRTRIRRRATLNRKA
jgi:antitoxin ParD1/3/4